MVVSVRESRPVSRASTCSATQRGVSAPRLCETFHNTASPASCDPGSTLTLTF
jgi:hypothetical protein